MLVRTGPGPARSPASAAPPPRPGGRPGRGPRAVARPSSRKATRPGAASTPAWRMPPPSRLRSRRASAITSSGPASSEPTGAQSPLDRQHITVVAGAAQTEAATPVAASALKRRAPSRWMGTSPAAAPRPRVAPTTTGRPPAAMCVFSMLTSETAGWWYDDASTRPSARRPGSSMPSSSSTAWNCTDRRCGRPAPYS